MRNILTVLIVIIAVFMSFGCKKAEDKNVLNGAVYVKLEKIKYSIVSVPVHTSGRLYTDSEIRLSFKTGGVIKRMYKNEGDEVKKGELLAELDISEVNAYFVKAKNGLEKSKRDLERVQNLYNDKAATLEQYQNVKTAYNIAESNFKIAGFNLKYSAIKAPSRGKILKKISEDSEIIAPGYPVYLFGSVKKEWIVKCGVSETELIRISKGDKVSIGFEPYGEEKFNGFISSISDSIDPSSMTYEVKIKMLDKGKKLAPGFVAKVDIYPNDAKKYPMISYDSLSDSIGNRGTVFTVLAGKAVKLGVKIIHMMKRKIAVEFNTSIPEFIVTEGAPYLNDGTKVEVVKGGNEK